MIDKISFNECCFPSSGDWDPQFLQFSYLTSLQQQLTRPNLSKKDASASLALLALHFRVQNTTVEPIQLREELMVLPNSPTSNKISFNECCFPSSGDWDPQFLQFSYLTSLQQQLTRPNLSKKDASASLALLALHFRVQNTTVEPIQLREELMAEPDRKPSNPKVDDTSQVTPGSLFADMDLFGTTETEM
ncbi:unnamed protein product [Haemonchus placei]|uniref:Condensin complex subunit 2 n=1 Tax=Haemonchus placei TaxID=6290 RepID=A0A0N4XBB2_HAEPC|nr:unnamed protein product [Haemonchus placei]